jgi:hypothetical protein
VDVGNASLWAGRDTLIGKAWLERKNTSEVQAERREANATEEKSLLSCVDGFLELPLRRFFK